jgi:hypothetical protein
MGMIDVTFTPNAHLVLHGEEAIVGHNDDSVCLQIASPEPIYMDVSEAEMLIAALRVAIEQVGT